MVKMPDREEYRIHVDTEDRRGRKMFKSTNLERVGPVIDRPRRDGMGKERRLRQKARRRQERSDRQRRKEGEEGKEAFINNVTRPGGYQLIVCAKANL